MWIKYKQLWTPKKSLFRRCSAQWMIDLIIALASQSKITESKFLIKTKLSLYFYGIHFSLLWISSLETFLRIFPISVNVNTLTKILYWINIYIAEETGRTNIIKKIALLVLGNLNFWLFLVSTAADNSWKILNPNPNYTTLCTIINCVF